MSKISFAGSEPRRWRSFTMKPDDRLQMVKLWRQGVPNKELAEQFGVHPDYVRKAAYRMGFRGRAAIRGEHQ